MNSEGLYVPTYHVTSHDLTRHDMYNILGFHVRNIDTYRPVFTHKSMQSEHTSSYERLEILGDSIINFSATNYLYNRYTDSNEGEITKLRSRMVDTAALSTIGKALNLGNYICIKTRTIEHDKVNGSLVINDRIHEDMFEALVGALYLDLGFCTAEEFFLTSFLVHVPQESVITDKNFKEQLMQWSQSNGNGYPIYRLVREANQHIENWRFEMQAYVSGVAMGIGRGATKKEASQAAAHETLLLIATDSAEYGLKPRDSTNGG